MSLKEQLKADLKDAMRAKELVKRDSIRAINTMIKQVEVDERIEPDDTRVLSILDKMAKQRRESISQFEKANRNDLIEIEQAELEIIQQYLPEALSDAEIDNLIAQAIETSGATEMKQMGQVMGILKPQLQGRADMGKVSQLIKSKLSAN